MEQEKCRATRLGKMDRYREVIVKPVVKIAHLRHRACRLLAGCFSLEVSAGIMRRDYEWDETLAWHSRGFFSSRLLPHSAIPPYLAFFSTRPTPFVLAMSKRSSEWPSEKKNRLPAEYVDVWNFWKPNALFAQSRLVTIVRVPKRGEITKLYFSIVNSNSRINSLGICHPYAKNKWTKKHKRENCYRALTGGRTVYWLTDWQ